MYMMIYLVDSNSLTSSFSICITLISCSCLALAKTSSTILNRCEGSGQICLTHDFSGVALSFFPFSLMSATGLLYIAFIVFWVVPYIIQLYKIFIMKEC